MALNTVCSGMILLACLLWLPAARADLPREVRVRLFDAVLVLDELTVVGPFEMKTPMSETVRAGTYRIARNAGGLRLDGRPVRHLVLMPVSGQGIQVQAPGSPPRRYGGKLEIRPGANGRLEVINTVPAQTYVQVVVGSETPPGWPLEALKAQAVLTQSGLARYRPGDVLGDSTQREAYLGLDYARPAALSAVRAVWGERLVLDGQPVTPYYHASCGGHTSGGELFNPRWPLPWLVGVPCPYCSGSPFSRETRHLIPKSAFLKVFPAGIPRVAGQDSSGRPLMLAYGDQANITAYRFWLTLGQRLGWDKAPGTRFRLSESAGQILVRSTGAGHGVGLCQHGAAGMARQGKNYREILRYYFPKLRVTPE